MVSISPSIAKDKEFTVALCYYVVTTQPTRSMDQIGLPRSQPVAHFRTGSYLIRVNSVGMILRLLQSESAKCQSIFRFYESEF